MEGGAGRIADAVMRGEQVAIFGDYDVDGATSAALLASFLRHCGLDPLIHIPDRLFEGYGPNVEAIRSLAGARRHAAGDGRLRHHQPRAAGRSAPARHRHRRHRSSPGRRGACRRRSRVVNPNRLDDLSGLGHLAAVGLVFVTAGRGQSRTARARLLDRRAAGARPAGPAASGRARHRRRRGAAERAQPRLRRQGPDRDAPPRARRP